jgi:hypothetical protein
MQAMHVLRPQFQLAFKDRRSSRGLACEASYQRGRVPAGPCGEGIFHDSVSLRFTKIRNRLLRNVEHSLRAHAAHG